MKREYNTDDGFDIFSQNIQKVWKPSDIFLFLSYKLWPLYADEEKISEDHELKEIV